MTGERTAIHAGLPLSFDAAIDDSLLQKPVVVFNLSGGKDSGATAYAVDRYLDRIGHPRRDRYAVHADLGRIEWPTTLRTVERTAAHIGVPLLTVRRPAGDLITRWETRFANAKTRYAALDTYRLVGPWSASNQRFCTSELKVQVIGPALAKRFRGRTILQVLGVRRAESRGRARTPVSAFDRRHAPAGNAAGTAMVLWNPAVTASTAEVFAAHAENGIPLHEAYTVYGSSRLSCSCCVLASVDDLAAAARCPGNGGTYRHLVGIEAESTFSFQPSRWLADVAPALLPDALAGDIARAKVGAAERRALEAQLPPGMGDARCWPARVPTPPEADVIAQVRAPLLKRHGIENRYPTGRDVARRFEELLAT